MDGIGAYHAEDGDGGNQNGVRQAGDLGKAPAAQKTDAQHEELDQHESGKEGIGHFRRLAHEEVGTGGQALDNQAAH